MKNLILLSLSIFISQACGKPEATVFEDKRLSQEELVKICLTGDSGKDTPLQQEIAEAMEREKCQRIFILGDVIYPSGINSTNDSDFEEKFLKYYQPLLNRNPALEIGIVLGNHDHKKDPSTWKDVPKKYPGVFFPHYYYMVDYGGLCLVALDTSFYYYADKVKEMAEQTKWMTQMQSRFKECDVKVALTHHPLKGDYFSDWEGASGALKAFLETYIIGKFDVHAAGHVHVAADDGKDEGTRLLISGSGGEVSGGRTPGYIVLTWAPSNPKRLGYLIREIDVEPNVYNAQMQEGAPDEIPIIRRPYVEASWLTKLWLSIKSFF